ncbi:MAG: dephospho-CoA kinase [Firmicutes bacterium]|nr:dephospho-CoA kinase [Bacillota bacterium]
MTQNKPYIIGLTGNSGSGKGEVCRILEKLGCHIIDCDRLAHENMAKGGCAYDDIVNAFGKEILGENGEIDRRILGGIVFNDKKKLELLNGISHGHITKRIADIIAENADKAYIVIDAPLLREAGLMPLCDAAWLVDADEKLRLERVMRRDGITREKALERFKNQVPSFDHHDIFDIIIMNNYDDISQLGPIVKKAFYALNEQAKQNGRI